MKNTKNKKGQKHGLWQTLNKDNTLLIEKNYKNGVLHGKRTDTYKEDLFRERFYMNGQFFGENLRNDKQLIHKFHELIDDGEWKVDKRCFHSKFWFVNGKRIFEYDYQDIKNKELWTTYRDFWSVFELEFDMGYQEIRYFIQHQVEKHFKLKVDKTAYAYTNRHYI